MLHRAVAKWREPQGFEIMSSLAFTREQSRRVDQLAQQEFGFSGLVLMENAGRGVADVLCRLGIAGTVVICCGKGNNAGDGFVIARHLDLRGHQVRVLLWAAPEELTGDAATNYHILCKTDVPIEVFGSGKRGQVQFVRSTRTAGSDRRSVPANRTCPLFPTCWKARRGSSIACWAPAPAVSRARRWTR